MLVFSSCIKCDSLSDSNCTTKPENCNLSICSAYEDVCFTYIDQSGIRRGCLNDQSPEFSSKCKLNNEICKTCSTAEGVNCNNVTIEIESCVECDSRKQKYCHDQPHLYKSKVCNDLNSNGREGCYLEQVSYILFFVFFLYQELRYWINLLLGWKPHKKGLHSRFEWWQKEWMLASIRYL